MAQVEKAVLDAVGTSEVMDKAEVIDKAPEVIAKAPEVIDKPSEVIDKAVCHCRC